MPTQVQDVYKVRRGKWTNLKIWSQVDLGTCRRRDLFVTDANFKEITIESIEYNFDDNYGVYNAFIHHLNGIEVDPNTGEVLEQKEKYAEPEIEVDENAGLLDVKGNIIGAGRTEGAPVVKSDVFGGLL